MRVKSFESTLLHDADQVLADAATSVFPKHDPTDARLAILEASASFVGGWDLDAYRLLGGFKARRAENGAILSWGEKVLTAISGTEIPTALALSALAREILPATEQRSAGAYYTDWRLAQMLAGDSVPRVTREGVWIDPACGTGVLLAAAALTVPQGIDRDLVIRERLVGADMSERALRGALLSVAALTSNLDAIRGFASRLLCQDSLRSEDAWRTLAGDGAALVIGNPPWEKLRATKHEVAQRLGMDRKYGQSFINQVDPTLWKRQLVAYVSNVASGMRLQGKGETDLYKLFLELGIGLAAEGGILAMLVPAGLIRSQGTEALRREIDDVASEISIGVMENRARHFAIDTRFKFIAVTARIGGGRKKQLRLRVADREGILPVQAVGISRREWRRIRLDLTVPEVRSKAEWDLFRRLSDASEVFGNSEGAWGCTYRREVDMTLDRHKFVSRPGRETVPLLEGRHVAQFRWRAKSYVSGEGRAAIWRPEPIATANLGPQWFIPFDELSEETQERIGESRVGMCDITGQTNERSLLVARIPEGHVCGNKVPTLVFEGGQDRADLFIALANSFAVDWMLRRLVTTTVNYFLLKSLPLPKVTEENSEGRLIVELSREIQAAEGKEDLDLLLLGTMRAQLDAVVATTWGLSVADMELILEDFPLLDRGQPGLKDEQGSTVTSDFVLATMAELQGARHPSQDRLQAWVDLGAIPYVPAEYV